MPKKIAKLMVFTGCFTTKIYTLDSLTNKCVIRGVVNHTYVTNNFGEDFEYHKGDFVNWQGAQFEVVEVGEKTLDRIPIMYNVSISRLVLDQSRIFNAEDHKKWEDNIQSILDKKRYEKLIELEKIHIKEEEEKDAQLAVQLLIEEKKKLEEKQYTDKCSTGIGALEI